MRDLRRHLGRRRTTTCARPSRASASRRSCAACWPPRSGRPSSAGAGDQVVLGLSGNPASAAVALHLLGRPLLGRPRATGGAGRRSPSRSRDTPGRAELVRCVESAEGLMPMPDQGAHAITSLTGATALAMVPPGRGRGRRAGGLLAHGLSRGRELRRGVDVAERRAPARQGARVEPGHRDGARAGRRPGRSPASSRAAIRAGHRRRGRPRRAGGARPSTSRHGGIGAGAAARRARPARTPRRERHVDGADERRAVAGARAPAARRASPRGAHGRDGRPRPPRRRRAARGAPARGPHHDHPAGGRAEGADDAAREGRAVPRERGLRRAHPGGSAAGEHDRDGRGHPRRVPGAGAAYRPRRKLTSSSRSAPPEMPTASTGPTPRA